MGEENEDKNELLINDRELIEETKSEKHTENDISNEENSEERRPSFSKKETDEVEEEDSVNLKNTDLESESGSIASQKNTPEQMLLKRHTKESNQSFELLDDQQKHHHRVESTTDTINSQQLYESTSSDYKNTNACSDIIEDLPAGVPKEDDLREDDVSLQDIESEEEFEGEAFEKIVEKYKETKSKGLFKMPLSTSSNTPAYYRRPFITSGYRVHYTVRECVKSMCTLHNETWNIWTHLISFLLFLALFLGTPIFILIHQKVIIRMEYQKHIIYTLADIIVFLVYTGAATYTFFSSTSYHLFGANGARTNLICYKLDVSAISGLIGTSYIPAIFYGFYCRYIEQSIYIAGVSIFAMIGMILPFSFLTRFKVFGHIRTIFFVSMVIFCVIPGLHWLILEIVEQQFSSMSIECIVAAAFMLLLYGIGFLFWITKFPERCRPGLFDYWFSSHTLWHCFISVATIFWYGACLRLYFQQASNFCT